MNRPTREEQNLMDRLELINIESFSCYPLSVRSYGTDNETVAIESSTKLFGNTVRKIGQEFNGAYLAEGELVIYD